MNKHFFLALLFQYIVFTKQLPLIIGEKNFGPSCNCCNSTASSCVKDIQKLSVEAYFF